MTIYIFFESPSWAEISAGFGLRGVRGSYACQSLWPVGLCTQPLTSWLPDMTWLLRTPSSSLAPRPSSRPVRSTPALNSPESGLARWTSSLHLLLSPSLELHLAQQFRRHSRDPAASCLESAPTLVKGCPGKCGVRSPGCHAQGNAHSQRKVAPPGRQSPGCCGPGRRGAIAPPASERVPREGVG